VEGTYYLQVVFTQPGYFSFPSGVILRVYETCNETYFEAAPVVSPDNQDYFIGFNDTLAVYVEYVGDNILKTINYFCGPFEIVTELDSVASRVYSDSINSGLTSLQTINSTNLEFFSK
jgi:hypothetical protein